MWTSKGPDRNRHPLQWNTAGADDRADAAVVRDQPGVLGKRAGFPNLDVWRLHHGKPPHSEFANPALNIDDDVALVGLAWLQAVQRGKNIHGLS